MKQKMICRLVSSLIAGGTLLTCAAAVSAHAAEDKGTAFLYVNDTDGKFTYEGEDSSKNTIKNVTTQTVDKDGSYEVSFDLGSDTMAFSALQLDITGMKHAKDVKITNDSLKFNGEEVKLDSTPSAKVTDSEIEVVLFNTSGEQLFKREDYNQTSKAEVKFTVENWYQEEETTEAPAETKEEATTEAAKETVSNGTGDNKQDDVKPVPTGDAGVTGIVLVMGTSVLAGALAFSKKK